MEAKVYEPFPDGTVPEGWPREYVSKADYVAALADIHELQEANREWALNDAKTRTGWFLERIRELTLAARSACSEMGCYCESDPPDRSCVMCKLGALVSSQSSGEVKS